MKIYSKKIVIIIAFICCNILFSISTTAQFAVSSPYSRYGIGNMNNISSSSLKAMGGIGYAIAKNNDINFVNPASFYAIDTQSFVFNIGFDMSWNKLSNNTSSSNAFLANINNISFAFPIIKQLKMAIGLMPVSNTNYKGIDSVFSDVNYIKSYVGEGEIDRVMIGLSYQVLDKQYDRLSIGVNASYYFGNLKRNTSTNILTSNTNTGTYRDTTGFVNSATQIDYNVSSFGFDFGMQYFHKLQNNNIIGFGMSLTPAFKLNTDETNFQYTYYNYLTTRYLQDTIQYSTDEGHIKMPMKIGGGISFEKPDKLFAELDFTYTKWSSFEFKNQIQTQKLKNNIQLNAGVEYIPNVAGILYYEKMAYRLGLHYDNGYIFLQDNRINNFGITFGIALPIKKIGTKINLYGEYGTTGTKDNDLIKEKYFKLGLSISAKDRWFVKRKYR